MYRNFEGILTYIKRFLYKMTENMQSDFMQSHQACFVRCCLRYFTYINHFASLKTVAHRTPRGGMILCGFLLQKEEVNVIRSIDHLSCIIKCMISDFDHTSVGKSLAYNKLRSEVQSTIFGQFISNTNVIPVTFKFN